MFFGIVRSCYFERELWLVPSEHGFTLVSRDHCCRYIVQCFALAVLSNQYCRFSAASRVVSTRRCPAFYVISEAASYLIWVLKELLLFVPFFVVFFYDVILKLRLFICLFDTRIIIEMI
jgi:hypothetical protein